MQRTLLATLLCALLSACSTEPAVTPAAASPAAVPPPALTATPAPVTPVAPESEAARRERIIKDLSTRSVYFGYDNFAIGNDQQAVIRQSYELLKSVPNASVRLEGNADERGSTEYNLALGQKRAEAVRRALELLGLSATQLEAISYGKEKPRAVCHEEKCWAENRRVDFAGNKAK